MLEEAGRFTQCTEKIKRRVFLKFTKSVMQRQTAMFANLQFSLGKIYSQA